MGRRHEYDSNYYRDRVRQFWKNCPHLTNQEIGVYFGISGRTVGKYLKRVKKSEL